MVTISIRFRLKSIRKLKNISQQRLSKLTGFSQSYISELENGFKSPTLKVVGIIATALKVHPYELIDVGLDAKHLLLFLIIYCCN